MADRKVIVLNSSGYQELLQSSDKLILDAASEFKSNVHIDGNLTVTGTSVTFDTVTLSVDDINIELGAIKEVHNIAVTPENLAYTLSDGSNSVTTSALGASPTIATLVTAIEAASGYSSLDFTVTANINNNGIHLTYKTLGAQSESATLTKAGGSPISASAVTNVTDATANGGGFTLYGSTPKTFNWVSSTGSWTSSENIDLASGKDYKINGTSVLTNNTLGSGVTGSSLTSVGTIATGVWNGTAIALAYGGTGYSSYSNGQLLIGKADGTLAKAFLTQGTNTVITNGDGSIEIVAKDTTYTISAEQTGGSDVDPDIKITAGGNGSTVASTVALVGGGGTTVTRNSASQITISSAGDQSISATQTGDRVDIALSNNGGYVTLTGGTATTITRTSASEITIAGQDTTYSAATTSAAGLMSATDKTQLDALHAGSNVNYLRSNASDDFTGTLAHNNPGGLALYVRGGDSDTTLLRVSSQAADGTTTDTSGLNGFSLIYTGTGSNNNNSLDLYSDNQSAQAQTHVYSVTQDGVLDFKVAPTISSNVVLTSATTFGGDVSGTYNAIVVADNSHDHTIANITSLATTLAGKYATSGGTLSGQVTIDAGQTAQPLVIEGSANEKIALKEALEPRIVFYENTTEKAHLKWSRIGYLELKNAEDASVLRVKDALAFSMDGSTFYDVFHSGIDVDLSDSNKIKLGTGDELQIYHDGSFSTIKNTASGPPLAVISDTGIDFKNSSNTTFFDCGGSGGYEHVTLKYGGSTKLSTVSAGVYVQGTVEATAGVTPGGNITMQDNEKIIFGAANDLQIYHDATDDVIHSAGTSLRTRSNIFRANNAANTQVMFRAFSGGAFEAYHAGTKRLETISSGANITGKLGINATSPLYPLHIKNAMGSSPSYIHMEVTGTNTVGGGGGIAFDTSASNSDSSNGLYLATIAGVRNSDNDGSNDLIFSTTKAQTQNNSPVERFRIGSSGQIGIGGANYGTSGQVLTSNGAQAAPSWQGVTATSLGGFSSSQFLRSDADDGFSGTITGTADNSGNPVLGIKGPGPNIIRFFDAPGMTETSNGIDLVYRTGANTLGFEKSTDGTNLWQTNVMNGVTNFNYDPTKSGNKIWHAGNDGSGSGLDADTLDGSHASSFASSQHTHSYASTQHTHSYAALSGAAFTGAISTSGGLSVGTTNQHKLVHIREDSSTTKHQVLIQNRTNAVSTAGIAFIASGSDFSDGQYAAIECLSGGTGTTSQSLKFVTSASGGTPATALTIGSDQVMTGGTFHLGGSQIMSSGASLQVNGFMRTGTIYLHQGGGTPNTSSVEFSNVSQQPYWANSKIWHEGNDGSGSGLDADTVDGIQASSFLRSDADDTMAGDLTVDPGETQLNRGNSAGDILRLRGQNTEQHVFTTHGAVFGSSAYGIFRGSSSTGGSGAANGFNAVVDEDGGTNLDSNYYYKVRMATGATGTDNSAVYVFWKPGDGAWTNRYVSRSGSTSNHPQATTNVSSGTQIRLFTDHSNAYPIYYTVERFRFGEPDQNIQGHGADAHWQRSGNTLNYSDGGVTIAGSTVWHAGIDGAGSGLDADLWDGYHFASYLNQAVLTTSTPSFNQVITTNNGNGTNVRIGDDAWIGDINRANTIRVQGMQNGANGYIVFGNSNTTALGRAGTGALTYGGNTVWHTGNDGAGSTLDADKLDSQEGSYYLNYNNFTNTPTIPTNNNQLTNGANYVSANNVGVLNNVTHTSDGQYDVTLFGFKDGAAQSGNFSSKLSLKGGGQQTRDLQLSQDYGGYATIGTSWTSNFLDITSFNRVRFNQQAYVGNNTQLWNASGQIQNLGGQPASAYLRSNADDSFSGNLTGSGTIYLTGTYMGIKGDGGGVVLTTNDGYGNANVCFNHKDGIPDKAGSSCRIETSVDGNTGFFLFEIGNSVSANQAVTLTETLKLTTSAITYKGSTVWHAGNDGGGSLLDADKLDSQEGSYYLNYNNFTNTPNELSWVDQATGNYGTIKVDDDRSVTWAGYAIRDDWVFMSSGAETSGIYNDTDNEWAMLCRRNAQVELYYNAALQAETANGYFLANNQCRSPIYYDSANTAAHFNANGTSNIRTSDNPVWFDMQASSAGHGRIRMKAHAGDPVIEFSDSATGSGQDQVWSLGADDRNIGSFVIRWHNNTVPGSDWTAAGTEVFQLKAINSTSCNLSLSGGDPDSYRLTVGGTAYASSDMRAPLFYDSDNTSYYVNPGGDSTINGLFVDSKIYFKDSVSTNDVRGIYFDGGSSTSYAIYKESGAWSGTYPDLVIGFHTGIKIGGHKNYNGTRFYNSEPGGTPGALVMEVANGNDNVRVVNTFTASGDSRAPIFYDSDNTGYYVNAASTSALNAASFAGTIDVNGGINGIDLTNSSIRSAATSGWTGNPGAYGKIQYHSNRWYIVSDSSSNRIVQFRRDGSDKSYIGNAGEFFGTSNVRGTIFYDTNDTAYQLDPTSTGDSALRIRGGTLHGPNSTWSAYLLVGGDGRQNYTNNTTTASVCTTDGNLHLDAASGNNLYLNFYDGNSVYFGSGGNSNVAQVASNGTFRSPVFYDYNNTAYYLDANTTGTSLNVAGAIIAGGNVTAYSDIKFKENIKVIPDAVEKVKAMRGVTYTRNDLEDREVRHTGVIAQEVEQVLPEAVREGINGKTVAYGNMVGLLIEAIKEQQKQIDELKAKLL